MSFIEPPWVPSIYSLPNTRRISRTNTTVPSPPAG
jgi:hypothetical protein